MDILAQNLSVITEVSKMLLVETCLDFRLIRDLSLKSSFLLV